MERVNRIVFVDSSNFNGSSVSVKISSNFCSIFSNRPKRYISGQESVGGIRAKIGGNMNRGSGPVEITGVYKSDSVHPLHKSGSGDIFRGPLYCSDSLKSLRLGLVAQVHSGPIKSTQVQGVGVKMVGCPVRLYGIEVLSEEKRMLEIQWFEDVFDSLMGSRESNPQNRTFVV